MTTQANPHPTPCLVTTVSRGLFQYEDVSTWETVFQGMGFPSQTFLFHQKDISTAYCKTAVTPLLTYWSYYSLPHSNQSYKGCLTRNRDSNNTCIEKITMRLSYFYNVICYTSKMIFIFWNGHPTTPLLFIHTLTKIKQSSAHLIFIIGFLMLARWHLYIKMFPRGPFYKHGLTYG